MIESVEGILKDKGTAHAVIQTGGIAFHLPIPLSSYDKLPMPGQPASLFTHLAVKEDDLTLYGFATEEERLLFRKLILVSGIGPKIAMTAISGLSPKDLISSIVQGDTKRLSSISGIGKKMAERLVLELRDKFEDAEVFESGSAPEAPRGGKERDAVLALIALGYKQQEAKKLLEKALKTTSPDAPVEEFVRKALGGA